jgi:hypothetical protein
MYFSNLFFFLSTALCLSSYECEAADNAQEKERLKYLRQDKKVISNNSGPTPSPPSKEKDSHTSK